MMTSFTQPDHSHKVASLLRSLRLIFASFAVKGLVSLANDRPKTLTAKDAKEAAKNAKKMLKNDAASASGVN